MFRKRRNNENEIEDMGMKLSVKEDDSLQDDDLFGEDRKNLRDLIAPNGVNPNPADYLEIDDGGVKCYCVTLYIDKLPLRASFGMTFSGLFNFRGATSVVYIEPLRAGRATKKLDKRVVILDGEEVSAEKSGDRNRIRKIRGKMKDTEAWAADIEQGENKLYDVTFLFSMTDTDMDKLRIRVNDFHSRAAEKGIGICACYGCHPEAFLSTAPSNYLFKPVWGPVHTNTAKKLVMDKYSLACIFNHTRSNFSHRNGIIAGRNMHTGQPVLFDIYDAANDGYGLACAGKTGVGKSATIKMYGSRYADFGYKFASIDFESRGNHGEYTLMAEGLGGINFQIKANSKNIINLFEINEEIEFDEETRAEFPVLRLSDKIADLRNILMTMIVGDKATPDFTDHTAIEHILGRVIASLYEKRHIYDQDVDSLYEQGQVIERGRLMIGKVKKSLPTISEFYIEVLKTRKTDNNPYHDRAYNVIIDAMADYVKELYFCPECLKTFTRDEFIALTSAAKNTQTNAVASHTCGGKNTPIVALKGMYPYYDGQSTVHFDMNTPHINIDISQLPEPAKPVAQIIALNFLNENFVKRNSANETKAQKLVLLVDELHKLFPYKSARIFVSDVYRTARKRYVSPWSATQALSDYKGYKETEAILKNCTAVLLFKQDSQDKEFLLNNTILTSSQVEEVLSLGGAKDDGDMTEEEKRAHKGEMCLICNSNVTFVKVDYLQASEANIVETDMSKVSKMHGKKRGA